VARKRDQFSWIEGVTLALMVWLTALFTVLGRAAKRGI